MDYNEMRFVVNHWLRDRCATDDKMAVTNLTTLFNSLKIYMHGHEDQRNILRANFVSILEENGHKPFRKYTSWPWLFQGLKLKDT